MINVSGLGLYLKFRAHLSQCSSRNRSLLQHQAIIIDQHLRPQECNHVRHGPFLLRCFIISNISFANRILLHTFTRFVRYSIVGKYFTTVAVQRSKDISSRFLIIIPDDNFNSTNGVIIPAS